MSVQESIEEKHEKRFYSNKRLFWILGIGGILVMCATCILASILIFPKIEGVINPRAQVAGTYVNQGNSSEYLELDKDGTFYLKEAGMGFTGRWEIVNNVIRLHLAEIGLTMEARVEGVSIIDNEGKTWVREGERMHLEDNIGASDNSILGTWQKVSEPEMATMFSKDGAFYHIDVETGESSIYGTYKVLAIS